MNMAKFLKEKRIDAALTQLEVGQRLGFHKSQFISSLERGTSRPPVMVLKRMCEIYRVSEEEMRRAYLENAVEEAEVKAVKAWNSES
ncbi:hypothetical protein B9G79_05185 [Bdellovibrio bacteriovorus]|uniref:HTH cro/C1-type domain-containing protein n=2 Tax=Bdellovibrio bacteriovorus TaxID=959 RepID=A0A1Z3N6B1_BDEBC|nr:hypothetical protein B9G79_05185 [Bdellovibrio bacteriovorus]